jgi:hypothetical protein
LGKAHLEQVSCRRLVVDVTGRKRLVGGRLQGFLSANLIHLDFAIGVDMSAEVSVG